MTIAHPALTLFTPFGPNRPWAVRLWAKAVVASDLPNNAKIVVVDNSCDANVTHELTVECSMFARLRGFEYVRIDAPFGKRARGAGSLHRRMRDLWRLAAPHFTTGYVYSLESDVMPPKDILRELLPDLWGPCAASAARLNRRKERTPIVLPPGAQTGNVESVHMGCTLFKAGPLKAAIEAADIGHRAWDVAVCAALRDAGHTVYHRADVTAKHYIEEGRYV